MTILITFFERKVRIGSSMQRRDYISALPCAEKSFRNRIESNRNQIVFTIFRLIWNQTDVRLVPNQSENGK